MGYDVQFEGKTYTIEQIADDDCIVYLGDDAVDDTTAADVYMTALLKFLPRKESPKRFKVDYHYSDEEGNVTETSFEEKASSWAEIGALVDKFETESLLGSEVTSITLQGR